MLGCELLLKFMILVSSVHLKPPDAAMAVINERCTILCLKGLSVPLPISIHRGKELREAKIAFHRYWDNWPLYRQRWHTWMEWPSQHATILRKLQKEVWVRYMPEYQLPKMDKWCRSQHVRSGLWKNMSVQSPKLRAYRCCIVSFIERKWWCRTHAWWKVCSFWPRYHSALSSTTNNFLHYRHLIYFSVEIGSFLLQTALCHRNSTRSTHRALDDNDEAIKQPFDWKGIWTWKNAVVTRNRKPNQNRGRCEVTIVCSKIADTSGNAPKCPLHQVCTLGEVTWKPNSAVVVLCRHYDDHWVLSSLATPSAWADKNTEKSVPRNKEMARGALSVSARRNCCPTLDNSQHRRFDVVQQTQRQERLFFINWPLDSHHCGHCCRWLLAYSSLFRSTATTYGLKEMRSGKLGTMPPNLLAAGEWLVKPFNPKTNMIFWTRARRTARFDMIYCGFLLLRFLAILFTIVQVMEILRPRRSQGDGSTQDAAITKVLDEVRKKESGSWESGEAAPSRFWDTFQNTPSSGQRTCPPVSASYRDLCVSKQQWPTAWLGRISFGIVGEVFSSASEDRMYEELIQTIAVAVSWAEGHQLSPLPQEEPMSRKKKPKTESPAEEVSTEPELSEEELEFLAREAALISSVTSRFGKTALRRASEVPDVFRLRRPTGIPSLDLELHGGFPAGGISQIIGEDGIGKTDLCWRCLRQQQIIQGPRYRGAMICVEIQPDF